MAGYDEIPLGTRAELRLWLAANHATSPGIWLVTWRRPELGDRIPYEDLVQECLCFGWIDSTVRTLDEDRSAIRLTPRKPDSGWSRTNKDRLEVLIAGGQMAPAGLAAVERAKANGAWSFLDDVEDLVIPDDLAAALAAEGAQSQFEALSPGRRKQLLYWIKSAKRAATRAGRVAATAAAAAEGRSALD
ncbi:MAG: YdeI/OmpD-associated family protein [Candidatus Nanopelagicales bacterium]